MSECTEGGTVLSIDGQLAGVVCNGEQGEAGAVGETGQAGLDAQATGVIRDTLYCQLDDGATFLSVYLWSVPGINSALDNIALCRLGEAFFVDTAALIGTRCSLLSPEKGVIEIQVNPTAGTATASGDMVGTFDCS